MALFDMNKLDGIFGIGFLGAAVPGFFVYMASKFATLPSMVYTAQLFGFYSMLASIICLAVGGALLFINFLRTRKAEGGGISYFLE